MGILTAGLSPYLLGGVAALIIGLGAFAGCEHNRAERAVAQEKVAREVLKLAVAANASNVETIAAQTKALEEWKAKCAAPDTAPLVAQAKQTAIELEKLRRENRRLRDATPECTALMRASVTAACPGVDLGLRRLTAGCRDENGRNTCTDPESSATGTH